MNDGYYYIPKSRLQSADSAVATVFIGSNEKSYNIDTDRFINLSGPTYTEMNQTYTYNLSNNTPKDIELGDFLIENINNSETLYRIQYNSTGTETFDEDSRIEVISVSKDSVKVRYNESGRYKISAFPESYANKDKPAISYESSIVNVVVE